VEVLNLAVDDETSGIIEDADQLTIPRGVEVFEVSGPFFFGVANKFEEAEKQVTRKPKILIIRLRRVPFIDSTGLNNLRNFVTRTQKAGIKVILSGPVKSVYDALEKSGMFSTVGNENICADINLALERAKFLLDPCKKKEEAVPNP
jgi:SulP family sulfate permease